MRREPRPTRRGMLPGVGLAGLGGTLAGCSTAAVPYDSSEAGVVPGSGSTASAMAMPAGGASSGAMGSGSGSGGATGSGPMGSGSAGGRSAGSKGSARLTGKVLGAASEIPAGGGMIFTAEKVAVTQPVRGQYRAFSAVCTHVGCILDQVAGGTISCPCHGGKFKITDGTVVAGPPPAPLPRERIKIVGGKVVLL